MYTLRAAHTRNRKNVAIGRTQQQQLMFLESAEG